MRLWQTKFDKSPISASVMFVFFPLQYIYIHDTLAVAIECGHLHSLIHSTNNDSFSGL